MQDEEQGVGLGTANAPCQDTAIFISYRRGCTDDIVGRIRDRLSAQFGKESVFRDVESMEYGLFESQLVRAIERCRVALVVIGRDWIGSEQGKGSRLHQPNDFVAVELKHLIRRNVPLIPVLIDVALPSMEQLPKELHVMLKYQRAIVRSDTFDSDVRNLIDGIKKLLSPSSSVQPVARTDSTLKPPHRVALPRDIWTVMGLGSVGLLLAAVSVFGLFTYLTASGAGTDDSPEPAPTEVAPVKNNLGRTQTPESARSGQRELVFFTPRSPPAPALATTTATAGAPSVDESAAPQPLKPPTHRFDGGRFSTSGADREACEVTEQDLAVDSFSLMLDEVTAGEYARCVTAGTCEPPVGVRAGTGKGSPRLAKLCNDGGVRPDHPANCVTVGQGATYCAWLGGRLPTVAELQWAARDGNARRERVWGLAQGDAICWDRNDMGTCAVGTSKNDITQYGLRDLAANVAELTSDRRRGAVVIVGASFGGAPHRYSQQLEARWCGAHTAPDQATPYLGFRCAFD